MLDAASESRSLSPRPWALAGFAAVAGWPGYLPLVWAGGDVTVSGLALGLITLVALGASPFVVLALLDAPSRRVHVRAALLSGGVTAGVLWAGYTLALWSYVTLGPASGWVYFGIYIALASPLIVGAAMLIGWTSSRLGRRPAWSVGEVGFLVLGVLAWAGLLAVAGVLVWGS